MSLQDYLDGKKGAERPSWLRDLDDPECFEAELRGKSQLETIRLLAHQNARRLVASLDADSEGGSWKPKNLADLGDVDDLRPNLGTSGLLYPGRRHGVSGPPESAKTLFVYGGLAVPLLRQGDTVALIDLEMGDRAALTLFRDLGATDDDLSRLLYVAPDMAPTPEEIGALVAEEPVLAVIDAAAGAYDLLGLDDNKRSDVETFARVYLRGLHRAGIATVTIDHVVKDARNRGRGAIGSERKLGNTDVHLGFETVRGVTRGGSGLYRIETHKDRPGWWRDRGQASLKSLRPGDARSDLSVPDLR